jgi:hypothetical protein
MNISLIYKEAMDVAVHFERVVAGFIRYHKCTLGRELGKEVEMKKLLVILMAVGLFLGTGISVACAEVLYGLTFDEQLIAIDSTTGSGTLIGNLDSDMKGFGLAALNGRLYTFDQNADVVRELDSATGHTIDTIDIGIGNIAGEGAIAFRSDGLGFLTGYIYGMWSFDITAHSSTYIGANPVMDGLDFDSKDILYGLSQMTADLYIIDQVTGATTLVGPTGFTASNLLGGLAFGSDGTLYAVINNALYTLNKNTGAGTFIGNIGFSRVSGLTALESVLKVVSTGPAVMWIGLKNSDDQGTQFDLKTELYLNNTLIAEGESLCITGVTRNPSYAKEVTVQFGPISAGAYNPGAVLSLKMLTRIGTTPDGQKCIGPGGSHNSAVGLRLYYDAPNQPSRFGAEIAPDPMQDFFLHSAGGVYSIDNTPPTGAVQYKDSGSINYKNGNPWHEIGTWNMILN